MTRRSRRLLAAMAAVAAAAPALALGLPSPARAAQLDAFSVAGSGAGVRVTVRTGYSFVVEPDAMLPRAAASIAADTVQALASPLDPGDSVDALPGLGVPTAEGDVEYSTVNGCCPAPLPALPLPSPPPQFGQAVNPLITTYVAPWNPQLTATYEHAQVTYPNPQKPGAQQAGFPVGSNDGAPPDFTDLLGLLSAQSSLGKVSAGPGQGVADAGAGSAVSVPALGLRVGRISSHVDVHGDATGTVSNVSVTLHDVDLGQPSLPGVSLPQTPAGTSLLHIGALVVQATTQRSAAAAHATSTSSFEATGVTVAGQGARLDQNGLSVNGSPSPLNAVAEQLVAALNGASPNGCVVQPPINLPGLGSFTSQPSLHLDPPAVREQLGHGGNEDTVEVNGPTLCIATSAPVPGSNGFAATPTVYAITLGSLSSNAYGVSFPFDAGGSSFSPTLTDTGNGALGAAAGVDTSTTVTTPGGVSPGGAPSGPPSQAAPGRVLDAVLSGGILDKPTVVAVAVLAEIALLGTLWSSWLAARGARRRADGGDSPTTRMDLI